MNKNLGVRIVGCILGAILGAVVGVYSRLFVMDFSDIPHSDALASLCGVIGATGGAIGGALFGIWFIGVASAGVIGAFVGCYAGGYGGVAYARWQDPTAPLDYAFGIGYLAQGGALLGAVGGICLGVWLSVRLLATRSQTAIDR